MSDVVNGRRTVSVPVKDRRDLSVAAFVHTETTTECAGLYLSVEITGDT